MTGDCSQRAVPHNRWPMAVRRTAALICLLAAATVLLPGAPALGGGFDRAIEAASERVVKLYGLGAGQQKGYGTGVIVSEDGLVLTVFSLLIDAQRLRAVTADGTRYDVDVVHRDSPRQLALLKLKSSQDQASIGEDASHRLSFAFFDLSQETRLEPGDWIVAAGNPFKVANGAEPVSIMHGVFSTRTRLDARRRLKDFPFHGEVLVIDAITSNPGAPGSAVVNLEGRLVGMIGRVVVSNRTHTHFNYAMPRDVLHDFIVAATNPSKDTESEPDLTGVAVVKAWDPGIRVSRTGYVKVLPFVERVRRDSAAERCGVRKDDLILSVNGKRVPDVDAYDRVIRSLGSDKSIELLVRRGRAIRTIRVTP